VTDISQQTKPLGFATPDNWRVVRHPDFELIDEVRIRVVERWKESELSGSEWRFSNVVECLHKGVVLKARSFGSRMEWALLGVGSAAMEAGDSGVPDEVSALEKIVCAQPGCRAPAEVFYRVKALYDNTGHMEELPHSYSAADAVYVIRFCRRHKHRGDCALQDADHNYEELPHPLLAARGAQPGGGHG
jgi:hypothetical protein